MTTEQAKANTRLIRSLRATIERLETALRSTGNANGEPIAAYLDAETQVKYYEARAQRVHHLITIGLRKK